MEGPANPEHPLIHLASHSAVYGDILHCSLTTAIDTWNASSSTNRRTHTISRTISHGRGMPAAALLLLFIAPTQIMKAKSSSSK